MARDFDLLVVGDANPDVVLSGAPRGLAYGQREQLVSGGDLVLGGSGAITACGAARLGLRTAFAGRVGDDAAGRFVLNAMAERGVDVSHCVLGPRPTAMTVVLADGPDRAILTSPGCLPDLTVDDVPRGLARHVHVSSYFLQPALAAGLPGFLAGERRVGATTSLDTNDDPAGAWDGLGDVLGEVDVFLPNAAEAVHIARSVAARLTHSAGPPPAGPSAATGPSVSAGPSAGAGASGTGQEGVEAAAARLGALGPAVVVKNGGDGALAWERGRLVRAPAVPVEPVDTVGAGDSFNAGFLAARLRGMSLPECLRVAVTCGSLSTQAAGGTAAQPTWKQL
ncbi:carbohydrate kinase family protein [Nonomuraea deserti]|uniref:Carbohydrate kinase family protein n=1 Tax=Nonomuraea deserti TaxID=1848322 RepID=A0A4R4W539_9ACTN|nr:carbohydrate kinase family protein [Nonomuraea deserti]TDD08200.1 carbohydrate kinase family protein [Nonomuraea deserti]